MRRIVDFSDYQAGADLWTVAQSVDACWAKAGDWSWVASHGWPADDLHSSAFSVFNQLGRPIGSYLFVRPGWTSPETQISQWRENTPSSYSIAPMIDLEVPGTLSGGSLTAWVDEALALTTRYFGRTPVLYWSEAFQSGHGMGMPGTPHVAMVAEYHRGYRMFEWGWGQDEWERYAYAAYGGPGVPSGYNLAPRDMVWQFTSSAQVPGFGGLVDCSFVPDAAWAAITGGGPPPPPPVLVPIDRYEDGYDQVLPGETWAALAAKFYGRPELWYLIYNANEGLITEHPPGAVQEPSAGWIVKIPANATRPPPGPAPPPPPPPTPIDRYDDGYKQVNPGDTWSSMAAEFYGRPELWYLIYNANEGLITEHPAGGVQEPVAGWIVKIPANATRPVPVPTPVPVPPPPSPTPRTGDGYKQVNPGDTWSSMAAEFYGDPALWYLIYNANQDLITEHPDGAVQEPVAGWIVKIPANAPAPVPVPPPPPQPTPEEIELSQTIDLLNAVITILGRIESNGRTVYWSAGNFDAAPGLEGNTLAGKLDRVIAAQGDPAALAGVVAAKVAELFAGQINVTASVDTSAIGEEVIRRLGLRISGGTPTAPPVPAALAAADPNLPALPPAQVNQRLAGAIGSLAESLVDPDNGLAVRVERDVEKMGKLDPENPLTAGQIGDAVTNEIADAMRRAGLAADVAGSGGGRVDPPPIPAEPDPPVEPAPEPVPASDEPAPETPAEAGDMGGHPEPE